MVLGVKRLGCGGETTMGKDRGETTDGKQLGEVGPDVSPSVLMI